MLLLRVEPGAGRADGMVARNPYSVEGAQQAEADIKPGRFEMQQLETIDMRAAVEQFKRDLAAYQERRKEAIKAVRERIGNPHWMPRNWQHLGIGPPSENPTAKLRVGSIAIKDKVTGETRVFSPLELLRPE